MAPRGKPRKGHVLAIDVNAEDEVWRHEVVDGRHGGVDAQGWRSEGKGQAHQCVWGLGGGYSHLCVGVCAHMLTCVNISQSVFSYLV